MKCDIRQYSDQTRCESCGLAWDTNDARPPQCLLNNYSEGNQHARQTRFESMVEITANYVSGFALAYLVYDFWVLPYPELAGSAFWVTTLFTVVSVVRTYVWRRFFNAQLHTLTHSFIKRFI